MLSNEILNFELVDRQAERDYIQNFLLSSELSDNVLWITGNRGVGKSYLLTEYVLKYKKFVKVYINGELNNVTQGYFVKKLINQLSSVSNTEFVKYLKRNYKSMIELGKKTLNIALNFADLDDNGIFDLTSLLTNVFISHDDERENIVAVLIKYTQSIVKKQGNIIFIFDNFTYCDSYSLELIIEMIHTLSSKSNIKYILCTTDEDMVNRTEIKNSIVEKIPHKFLKVKPFAQQSLFTRMLDRAFDLDRAQLPLLSMAFRICKGVPQKFKEILINLYVAQGIIINGNKAQIISDIFQDLLCRENICFNIDELCASNTNIKKILQLIAWFGAPIPAYILSSLFCFILNINDSEFLTPEINEIVNKLEAQHIITFEYNNGVETILFKHDSLCGSVRNYFRNDKFIPFMQHKIYEYLKLLDEKEKSTSYWIEFYDSLCSYHSFYVKSTDWIKLNFEYGNNFFRRGLFQDAKEIFERLDSVLPSLSCEQLLSIGISNFYCGEYDASSEILSIINGKDYKEFLSVKDSITMLIFLARAKFCLLKCEEALEIINKAEDISNEIHLKVQVMATKQSILFLTPNGASKAKEIFDNLVHSCSDIKEMSLIYQSAMDYYEGYESKQYLNKGLKIALENDDIRTEGKILNNIGFECLRCGQYLDAESYFEESILKLSQCQPHEQAYPLNNLAVLKMIKKDYSMALDDLAESVFWNKSEYLSLVIKNNRMLCYFFEGNCLWKELFDYLEKYIHNSNYVDDKIYKKIGINLALISSKNNNPFKGIEILELCGPHLENEWTNGKFRYSKLYSELTGNTFFENSISSQYEDYYCKIDFEPWLVNFSHD